MDHAYLLLGLWRLFLPKMLEAGAGSAEQSSARVWPFPSSPSLLPLHPLHSASVLHLLLCPPLLNVGWGALGWGALPNRATNPLAFLQFRLSSRVQPLVLSPSPPPEINPLLKSRADRDRCAGVKAGRAAGPGFLHAALNSARAL